ncbi:MAG: endonuclease III [Pseudomonadota bacterium]
MQRAVKAKKIVDILESLYPETPVPLDHSSTFELLIAVLLSAQTTDKKVNEVTPALFARGPTPHAMADVPEQDILNLIRQLGLAPQKAKNISRLSQMLVEQGGDVPDTYEGLEALPGVGHKTAAVVMSQAFGVPAFPVDTHIHRLAARWGLSDGSNVTKTERDLKRIFPESLWNKLHLQIIFFGREYCPARFHVLEECPICSFAATKKRMREERAENDRLRNRRKAG